MITVRICVLGFASNLDSKLTKTHTCTHTHTHNSVAISPSQKVVRTVKKVKGQVTQSQKY